MYIKKVWIDWLISLVVIAAPMRSSQALQQCNALTHSGLHSLQRIVITVLEHDSAPGALPGLSSPGQCSFTAPQAAFVCDTRAHSHPSPEPGTWHMHGCRCRFTSCLLKYEAISCEWRMVRESGRLGAARLCCLSLILSGKSNGSLQQQPPPN